MINSCHVCTPVNRNRTSHHILTRFCKLTLCISHQVDQLLRFRKTDNFKKLLNSGQSISAACSTLVHSFTNSLPINAFYLSKEDVPT